MSRDIYQNITDRFVEQLEKDTVPWQKPSFGVQNMVSRKQYRGINSLLLGYSEFQSPRHGHPTAQNVILSRVQEGTPVIRQVGLGL